MAENTSNDEARTRPKNVRVKSPFQRFVMRFRGVNALPHFFGLPVAKRKAKWLIRHRGMWLSGLELQNFRGIGDRCTVDTWGRISWHPKLCNWEQDKDFIWETDCGGLFDFTNGGPYGNSMKFCCYCGAKLKFSDRF